jgi:arylsulfatase
MNNFTERTWLAPLVDQEFNKIMGTFIQYPPRKLQSLGYTGPVTISNFQKFEWLRNELKKEGVHITLPSGN